MAPAKRVAVIGLGPAGAITIDALGKEECFDMIRVFERREGSGGCWNQEANPMSPAPLQDIQALSTRAAADLPPPLPEVFPADTPRTKKPRFAESSVYPYLETNVSALAMEFSQEPFPTAISPWSKGQYGSDSPFRHWKSVKKYVEVIAERAMRHNGVEVEYNTTVERCEKIGEEWKLILRREEGGERDFWWEERFDAVVVASGHWSVPYIPSIPGLVGFEKGRVGSVLHSKHFRGREAFKGKRVVVVGASVSAADISIDLLQTALLPIHSVVLGHTPNTFFGDIAFQHPHIQQHRSISHISPSSRIVYFVDGTCLKDVDHIIFGTGYSWTIPFLPQTPVRNNRVPDLYQHIVWRHDPSLLFIGAVGPGLTFKIFEWQAILAARLLAGRTELPSREVMERWEKERIAVKGDGPKFTLVYPNLEDYFETVRGLAGDGLEGKGRQLVPFQRGWMESFEQGIELRKGMWRRLNDNARRETEVQKTKLVESFLEVTTREVVRESPRL